MRYCRIGADPEFFIVDQDGKPVPAHKAGLEDQYHTEYKSGYRFFRDGYVLEVNLAYPAYCVEIMRNLAHYCLIDASRFLAKNNLKLKAVSAMEIDLHELKDAPEDVKRFGCEPSLCAYTGRVKVPTLIGTRHKRRYAGGHMHFSTLPKSIKPDEFVKLLDLYVGIPMAVIFNDEGQALRREYYGQAGEFRLQSYPNKTSGIEYRTPPSEMWSHDATVALAYRTADWVLGMMKEEKINPVPKNIEKKVRLAINECRNPEELLQKVPGLYTPDDILKAKETIGKESRYQFLGGSSSGWQEWASYLKFPGKDFAGGKIE